MRREQRLSPTNAKISGDADADARAALVLPGPDGMNLSGTLAQPVVASVPDFGWRTPALREASVVRPQVDDPDGRRGGRDSPKHSGACQLLKVCEVPPSSTG